MNKYIIVYAKKTRLGFNIKYKFVYIKIDIIFTIFVNIKRKCLR